jgi:2,3-di-O-geranylgeranylglyceryl phosphate reductase (EC 1.3.99.-)
LVIDRNSELFPGRKSLAGWVCGDACSKEAVDFMSDRIKVQWTRPEIEHDVKGVMAFHQTEKQKFHLMVLDTC